MEMRPAFHFTPPANWLNDPNGLVYYAGEYHLFYQYHPHSTVWGPMHWGHAVSRDLLNWEHLPIALYPDEMGVIYSGSAVVDWNDTAGFGKETLVAIFTYNKNHTETQNLAFSSDKGRTWTKFSGNPVLVSPPAVTDFRDPKVFWQVDHWVMLLAVGDKVLFYSSPNLKDWSPSGSFGPGWGSTDGVWETPDLFQLPVDDGPETRWVLTVGVGTGGVAGGSATQYFIGHFDGASFTSENPAQTILWADYGADFYALQSWSDEPQGRRLVLAWMNNWQYARVVPASTWRGMFSLPRELSLTRVQQGIRLRQQPAGELKALRDTAYHCHARVITPSENPLSAVRANVFEIVAEFEVSQPIERVGFRLRVGNGEFTMLGYDVNLSRLFLDRSNSGQCDFSPDFGHPHFADLPLRDGVLRLHIFIDRQSVEVFADDGLLTFTDSIFPSAQSQGIELFAQGGNLSIKNLDVYRLKPARFYN